MGKYTVIWKSCSPSF